MARAVATYGPASYFLGRLAYELGLAANWLAAGLLAAERGTLGTRRRRGSRNSPPLGSSSR